MTEAEKKELERKIAVMQAYLAGGSVERIRTDRIDNWTEMPSPRWDWASCDYRIAKPAKKKIKLKAWLDNETGSLGHYVEDCSGVEAPRFTRLPDLDIETEVTE